MAILNKVEGYDRYTPDDITTEGFYSDWQAFDNSVGHWAYPDTILLDKNLEVAFYGDTGRHGFAVSTCGIYLSSNGHARRVDVEECRATMADHIGKRLH